ELGDEACCEAMPVGERGIGTGETSKKEQRPHLPRNQYPTLSINLLPSLLSTHRGGRYLSTYLLCPSKSSNAPVSKHQRYLDSFMTAEATAWSTTDLEMPVPAMMVEEEEEGKDQVWTISRRMGRG